MKIDVNMIRCKYVSNFLLNKSHTSDYGIYCCSMLMLTFSWKMRTVLNPMKNQFSDFCGFYFLSYSWLYLQSTKNLPTKRKVFQKWPYLQKRCGLLWKLFFSSWVFFCGTFSLWDMVAFDMWPHVCKIIIQFFANLIQSLTSIQKHAGSREAAPVGVEPSSTRNFFILTEWIKKIRHKFFFKTS